MSTRGEVDAIAWHIADDLADVAYHAGIPVRGVSRYPSGGVVLVLGVPEPCECKVACLNDGTLYATVCPCPRVAHHFHVKSTRLGIDELVRNILRFTSPSSAMTSGSGDT